MAAHVGSRAGRGITLLGCRSSGRTSRRRQQADRMRHSRALLTKAWRRGSQGVFGARRVSVGMEWLQMGWRGRPAQRPLAVPCAHRSPLLSPSLTSVLTSAMIQLLRFSVVLPPKQKPASFRTFDVLLVSLDLQVTPPPVFSLMCLPKIGAG